MNHPLSSSSSAATSSPDDRAGERRAQAYEPPRIEDDLPLEVMSLACTGTRPKGAAPVPCKVLGS
ncbi:MAG: hypothetical protein EOO75_01985 [Myxococcales bacterium]|nr:MAG: hypothetical protein EOO75_01985 [Myxococcales bacterium]